ncbi:hypothetical protein BT69DRAFT_1326541 [Atractiella rhizophila]|nr:hypothetical protein BT69DRAFT_1326541 [Atractiella rhizophila]
MAAPQDKATAVFSNAAGLKLFHRHDFGCCVQTLWFSRHHNLWKLGGTLSLRDSYLTHISRFSGCTPALAALEPLHSTGIDVLPSFRPRSSAGRMPIRKHEYQLGVEGVETSSKRWFNWQSHFESEECCSVADAGINLAFGCVFNCQRVMKRQIDGFSNIAIHPCDWLALVPQAASTGDSILSPDGAERNRAEEVEANQEVGFTRHASQ